MWTIEEEFYREAKFRVELQIASTEYDEREPTEEEIQELLYHFYENGEF